MSDMFMFMFMSASAGPAGSSDQFTTIAVMVCDSHTLMHVPAKCPPKLHRCLRAESIQPSSLSPRVPWTHQTRCCGEEGYWILGVSNVNSGHSRPQESYVDLSYSHFCSQPYSVLSLKPPGRWTGPERERVQMCLIDVIKSSILPLLTTTKQASRTEYPSS